MDEKNKLTIENYKQKLRKVEVVEWPDSGKKVGIMQLNYAEIQEAYFAARESFSKRGYQQISADDMEFDTEKLIQRVYLFLVDPDSRTGEKKYRIFNNCDECKQFLTSKEMLYFASNYLELFE